MLHRPNQVKRLFLNTTSKPERGVSIFCKESYRARTEAVMQVITFEEAKHRDAVIRNTQDSWARQELWHSLLDDIRFTLLHSESSQDIQEIIRYFQITVT